MSDVLTEWSKSRPKEAKVTPEARAAAQAEIRNWLYFSAKIRLSEAMGRVTQNLIYDLQRQNQELLNVLKEIEANGDKASSQRAQAAIAFNARLLQWLQTNENTKTFRV